MITVSFDPIFNGSSLIGKRLTISFNKKIVSIMDFPAETEMTTDQLDAYVAGKLSDAFS
jgi:hypothetical protein